MTVLQLLLPRNLGATASAEATATAMIPIAVLDAALAEDPAMAKSANSGPGATICSKHLTLGADSRAPHHHAYNALAKKAAILGKVYYLVSCNYPDIYFAANQHLDSSKFLWLNLQQSYTLYTFDFLGAYSAIPLPLERPLHFLFAEHPLARSMFGAHWFPNSTHAMHSSLVYAPFDTGGEVPPGQHGEAQLIPLLGVHIHPHYQLLPSNTHISFLELLTILLDNLHQAVCLTTLALSISIYLCQVANLYIRLHSY
ncbi:hypothetical protein L7F22_062266 [Adiantum nelumboides]|nr:hypothetical protein [Adiantum nelumboides]